MFLLHCEGADQGGECALAMTFGKLTIIFALSSTSMRLLSLLLASTGLDGSKRFAVTTPEGKSRKKKKSAEKC